MATASRRRHGRAPSTQQTAARRPALHPLLLLACLFAATAACYYPAWHGGLLWDDEGHVTRAALQSWTGLRRIWFDLRATQQYYPITHSAFWVEHWLWRRDTLGYHLVNIALHATSALLLYRLLRRLAVPGALLATSVFAIHPIHVESVAWITEQKNTLSGVFFLAAALRYVAFDDSRTRRDYVAAIGLFIVALLAKSVTATLPGALLVLIWYRRGRLDFRRDVVPLLPLFALGAAAGLFTAWLERTVIGAQGAEFGFSPVERTLLAGRVVVFYLWSLVWPVHLIFNYPRWTVSQSIWWQYLFALAVFAAIARFWVIRARTRAPLAALLMFGGLLFPVLGFVNVYPFRFSFVADHFAYLASVPLLAGLCALLASEAARRHFSIWTARAASAVLVGLLGIITFVDSGHYVDAGTLYRSVLERNPASWLAHDNLGVLELDSRPQESLAHIEQALALNPDVAEIHSDYGVALQRIGRHNEAAAEFRRALALTPEFPAAANNLANTLIALGRYEEAEEFARRAIRVQPNYLDAHYNLALALLGLERPEAEQEFRTTLQLQPNFPEAHYYLGTVLQMSGRLQEAVSEYERAIGLKPDLADAHFNLGISLQQLGRQLEAVPHYQAAVRLMPGSPLAHNNLGVALASTGHPTEASAEFRAALRLQPDYAEAEANLARALARASGVR